MKGTPEFWCNYRGPTHSPPHDARGPICARRSESPTKSDAAYRASDGDAFWHGHCSPETYIRLRSDGASSQRDVPPAKCESQTPQWGAPSKPTNARRTHLPIILRNSIPTAIHHRTCDNMGVIDAGVSCRFR